jgi:hypothetical protein
MASNSLHQKPHRRLNPRRSSQNEATYQIAPPDAAQHAAPLKVPLRTPRSAASHASDGIAHEPLRDLGEIPARGARPSIPLRARCRVCANGTPSVGERMAVVDWPGSRGACEHLRDEHRICQRRGDARPMRLRVLGGDAVTLTVTGYRFPDANDPAKRYSWHVVKGEATDDHGTWSSRWQRSLATRPQRYLLGFARPQTGSMVSAPRPRNSAFGSHQAGNAICSSSKSTSIWSSGPPASGRFAVKRGRPTPSPA